MTRQTKTPRQRAEETLGIARRRVDRLTKQVKNTQDELEALEYDLDQAQQRLTYAQQDPALTNTPGGTTA